MPQYMEGFPSYNLTFFMNKTFWLLHLKKNLTHIKLVVVVFPVQCQISVLWRNVCLCWSAQACISMHIMQVKKRGEDFWPEAKLHRRTSAHMSVGQTVLILTVRGTTWKTTTRVQRTGTKHTVLTLFTYGPFVHYRPQSNTRYHHKTKAVNQEL